MQNSLLLLFLILIGLIIVIFTYVFLSLKRDEQIQTGMQKALQKRFWFILILFIVLAIFASITIPKSPYFIFADEPPAKIIHVASKQFYFIMSDQAIDPENPAGESLIELKANELVEFRVTSLDVNHGFAIYNSANELIAQTQAMPGYVNRLRWQFTEPGNYDVYCLEYCGMAHHVMKTSFIVK